MSHLTCFMASLVSVKCNLFLFAAYSVVCCTCYYNIYAWLFYYTDLCKKMVNIIMLQTFFFAIYCFSPRVLVVFFVLFSFSSRIAYHSPGIGRIKMPLGMDDPLGE